ncbi:hypothetical protein AHAS_Ahas12G0130100 [Arachis hypogaea]
MGYKGKRISVLPCCVSTKHSANIEELKLSLKKFKLQLKNNFLIGQVGLQNVMYATQMLFNPDLPKVVEFRQSMIEQGVNGTQPLFIANEGKVVSLEDDFMRLTRRCTIEELQDNNVVLLKMEVGGILLVHVERLSPRYRGKSNESNQLESQVLASPHGNLALVHSKLTSNP